MLKNFLEIIDASFDASSELSKVRCRTIFSSVNLKLVASSHCSFVGL